MRRFGCCRFGLSLRCSLGGRLFPAAIHKAVLDNRRRHLQIIRVAARKLQIVGLYVICDLAAFDCVKFADAVHGCPESSRCGLVTRGRQNARCARQCQHGHEAQTACPNSVLEGGFQHAALKAKAVLDSTTVETTTNAAKKRRHENRHSSAYLVADSPSTISWQCGRHSVGMGILVIVNVSTQIVTAQSSQNLTPFFLISRHLSEVVSCQTKKAAITRPPPTWFQVFRGAVRPP